MKIIKLLAAGAATFAIAAPAAAQFHPYQPPQQTYPQYQYPQQAQPYQYPQGPGYGYQQPGYGQNPVAQIINQLLGNTYQPNDRMAVTQCASAAMSRAAAQYQPRHQQQRYGHPAYSQHYNQAANIRVTAITDVRQQRNGLRVTGLMSSGMQAGHPPYGQAHGYHNQARADLSFTCNVARNGQVTNVRVSRAGHQRR